MEGVGGDDDEDEGADAAETGCRFSCLCNSSCSRCIITLSKNADIFAKAGLSGANVEGLWVEMSMESTPSSANSEH